MDLFLIDEILDKILYYADIQYAFYLLNTNTKIKNKIQKHYETHLITFTDMPLFRSCTNILMYLQHYNSYMIGKNFPDEPLWLFYNIHDCKYVVSHNMYKKLENIRYNHIKFFSYITTYKFGSFINGFYHWKRLNNNQKYVVWCCIRGIHPEIKLDKSLCHRDASILISEMYWHYQNSFSRSYMEIYLIDNCDLMNAKCIANNEILGQLEYYRINHFKIKLILYKESKCVDKNSIDVSIFVRDYCKQYNFDIDNHVLHIENNFRLFLRRGLRNNIDFELSFSPYKENMNINYLSDEISLLTDILNNINEFDITKTKNLRTNNIDYLLHMVANYEDNIQPNNCIQQ